MPASCFTSALFFPEVLVCVMLQLCTALPEAARRLITHCAVLLAVVDVWTITHVFGDEVPPLAGVHVKLLMPEALETCRTCFASVQFQSAPGQFGPA